MNTTAYHSDSESFYAPLKVLCTYKYVKEENEYQKYRKVLKTVFIWIYYFGVLMLNYVFIVNLLYLLKKNALTSFPKIEQ